MAKDRTGLKIDVVLFATFVVGFLAAVAGIALYDYRLALIIGGVALCAFALTVEV